MGRNPRARVRRAVVLALLRAGENTCCSNCRGETCLTRPLPPRWKITFDVLTGCYAVIASRSLIRVASHTARVPGINNRARDRNNNTKSPPQRFQLFPAGSRVASSSSNPTRVWWTTRQRLLQAHAVHLVPRGCLPCGARSTPFPTPRPARLSWTPRGSSSSPPTPCSSCSGRDLPQARSFPTGALEPTFVGVNALVYAFQGSLWTRGRARSRGLVRSSRRYRRSFSRLCAPPPPPASSCTAAGSSRCFRRFRWRQGATEEAEGGWP